jgi:arylsulfatase A-like enzyme
MPGRIPAGKVVKTAVAGVDIVPTIFSFAGLELPWEMHGNDLRPLLEKPDRDWPYPAMMIATGRHYGSDTNVIPKGEDAYHGGVPWYVMLRDGKYKYVRPLVEDLEELYDLEADPDELDNLAVKPEFRKTLEKLRAEAIAELRKDKAGFVDAMPPVRQ